ncbi:SRPN10 [Trypoxylus dichotomus]
MVRNIRAVPNGTPPTTKLRAILRQLNANLSKNVRTNLLTKLYVKACRDANDTLKIPTALRNAADAEPTDFSRKCYLKRKINDWVSDETGNRIEHLVEESDGIDSRVTALLLNVVHFSGEWLDRFRRTPVRNGRFYIDGKYRTSCVMMRTKDIYEYGESRRLNSQILKKRFKDKRFAMMIILPKSRTGMRKLESRLASIELVRLATISRPVAVFIPRFEIETKLDLIQPIKRAPHRATASVIHKVVVDINQHGVEVPEPIDREPIDPFVLQTSVMFKADHPFVFCITAQLAGDVGSDLIVLMGKVEVPKQ